MTAPTRVWSPPPMIANPWLRYGLYLGVAAYLLAATASVEVNWARVHEGLNRGIAFVASFSRPDFSSRWGDIRSGILESLTMTFASTVIGVALAVPIGLGAARNVAPAAIYGLCRGIIAVSRTFQEIIVAILFVAMFGFGPLAGMVTLAFATIGFMAKLLAEDIEDIDPAQVEAIQATGAGPLQVLTHGIAPQIMPALAGISVYRWDINIRESTVLGLVGAGGIGLQLMSSVNVLAWPQVTMIFIAVFASVLASEWISAKIRHAII